MKGKWLYCTMHIIKPDSAVGREQLGMNDVYTKSRHYR